MARKHKFYTDEEIESRIMENVSIDESCENPCWLWTGSLTSTGYGQISIHSRPRPAHRVSYILLKGPIPRNLEIDHLCRVRRCVNPNHLEPVTRSENTKRGMAGKAAATRAQERTHCKKGHELTGDNIRGAEKGKRLCKICYEVGVKDRNDRRPRIPIELRKPNIADLARTKTHCPHGHSYSGDNLIINKKGARICRECMRKASREYQRKKRAA